MQYCAAILLAAGSGTRLDSSKTKQTYDLLGKSILRRSAQALAQADCVHELVVVVRKDEIDFARKELSSLSLPITFVCGGETRQESARIGFSHISLQATEVLIHDAARCLITPAGIDSVVKAASECGAASAVSAVHDTVKTLDENGRIVSTINRDMLCLAATPQAFSVSLYKKAWQNALENDLAVTDDNMLVENLGISVAPIYLPENPKITTREDLLYAEFLLKKREVSNV